MDQLSGMDASFLHLETPETPMHVGSLMLFELPEGYDGDYYEDVKAMLGKRLHISALLTRKLAQMPSNWPSRSGSRTTISISTITCGR